MQPTLPDEAIRLLVTAKDWRAAVRQAGEALVAADVTTPDYTDQMIEAIEQLGPYIVIAPGVALAHARPSPAVKQAGQSWVTLETPVPFGNEANDPVWLVIGLAATQQDGHIDMLAHLARVLSDQDCLAGVAAARTPQQLRLVLASVSEG